MGDYLAKDAKESVKLKPMCWPGSLPGSPTKLEMVTTFNRKKLFGKVVTCELHHLYSGLV